ELALGPAVYDRQALALDIAGLLQAPAKSAQTLGVPVRRLWVEEPDHRRRGLLRPRRERPRRRRAAHHGDELAPFHSMTSSAILSSDGGTVRPSIRAVWALTTNSNLLDCTTGKSAGLTPLRTRPV